MAFTLQPHDEYSMGLLLLSRSTDLGIKHFEFELLNVASGRAHRLVFSGTGKCNLNSEGRAAINRWRQGGHYLRFDSKRHAAFGDFNASAKIAPFDFCHVLTIINAQGVLADVNVFPFLHAKSWPTSMNPADPIHQNETILIGSCRTEYGSGTPSKPLVWYVERAAGHL